MSLALTCTAHQLLPFDEALTGLSVVSFVERKGPLLRIEYRLGGDRAGDIRVPAAAPKAARKDGLWESTCFEAFIAEAGQPWYWELNLSPTLDWQAFHFRDYRQGSRPESRIALVRGERLGENSAGQGFLLTLDTAPLFASRATLDVGVTAVLEETGGSKSYWALSHAGAKPDFHLRKSFVLSP